MSNPIIARKFKVVLLGDAGVGKTAFIKRHLTGKFTEKYCGTMGVEVRGLGFHTSAGYIVLNCWDTAGQDKYAQFNEEYYKGVDAAVLMFDVTALSTYESLPAFYNKFRLVKGCAEVPVVLCGNKVDCPDRQVTPKNIKFHSMHNLQYYDISIKSNYNFENPFLYLLRKLTGDSNLDFVGVKDEDELSLAFSLINIPPPCALIPPTTPRKIESIAHRSNMPSNIEIENALKTLPEHFMDRGIFCKGNFMTYKIISKSGDIYTLSLTKDRN